VDVIVDSAHPTTQATKHFGLVPFISLLATLKMAQQWLNLRHLAFSFLLFVTACNFAWQQPNNKEERMTPEQRNDRYCEGRPPRKNFFDVGSNCGSVIEAFYEQGKHREKSTNPDWKFGIPNYTATEWHVYGFEASPMHTKPLLDHKANYNAV
jgi:hypothetical protein